MINPTELLIGKMMRFGLYLSVLVVLIGGIFYLIQCGNEQIHYQVFQPETQSLSFVSSVSQHVSACSAQSIIQIGLLILILTQVFRVLLTAWLFVQQRDYIFTWISIIILAVLIYSIFWRD